MFGALKNGKCCYIDSNGKILLECDFAQSFADFYDERAAVIIDKKWGFINSKGDLVIKPEYDQVRWFSEKACAVKINGKWGYINKEGDVIIEPKYYSVSEFCDGLAGVQEERLGDIAYINKEVKIVIKDNGRPTIHNFSEGLISCRDEKSGMSGYRNTEGEWHITPQYVTAQSFSEELAGVLKEDKAKAKTTFIDKDNNEILPAQYETVLVKFKDERAIVMRKVKGDYLSGCIDKKGELVIPIEFDMIKEFSDGLAQARLREEDRWGFINKNGEFQVKPNIERVYSPFRDGLALICSNDYKDLKYINKKGEVVFEFS